MNSTQPPLFSVSPDERSHGTLSFVKKLGIGFLLVLLLAGAWRLWMWRLYRVL